MKVCFDANVFISYLLRSPQHNPPAMIMRAAFAGLFEIVLNQKTIMETRQSVTSKPYLARRIQHIDVETLTIELGPMATIIPELAAPFPSVTRDSGDDYIITHAVLHAIDYLVTGDKDLLVLQQVHNTRIVSPAEFVAILDAEAGA